MRLQQNTTAPPGANTSFSQSNTKLGRVAAINHIVDVYRNSKPRSATYRLFEVFQQIYNKYKQTNNPDTLRYLYALILRTHHGNRMPWYNTKEAVDKLKQSNILFAKITDFELLHAEITKLFKNISFASGPLTRYDVSVNIGQLLCPKVEPQKHVYLTAGAMAGAVKLTNASSYNYTEPVADWQTADRFPGVASMDIEDILCIFEPILEKLGKGLDVTAQEIEDVWNKKTCIFRYFGKEYAISRMNNAVKPKKKKIKGAYQSIHNNANILNS